MARVLVVDDNSMNRQFLAQLFAYYGHEIAEAADGIEALEAVASFRPDAIVSDIIMPRLDGLEFAKQLRSRPELPQPPVIFYTATYRLPEARTLAQAAGVTEVMAKPSEPQAIVATLDRVLGAAAAGLTAPREEAAHRRPRIVSSLKRQVERLEEVRHGLAQAVDGAEEIQSRSARLEDLLRRTESQLESLQSTHVKLLQVEELGLNLAQERSLASLASMVAASCRAILRAGGAAFGLTSPDGASLRFFASEGLSPRDRATLETNGVRAPALARVLAEGKPVRLSETALVRDGLGLAAGVAWALVVPVCFWSEPHGWLLATRSQPQGPFTDEDQEILMSIAFQAGLASQNIDSYDELQKHDAELLLEVMERRRTESALAASEARLRWILDNISDCILAMAVDGRVTYVSPAVRRLLGYSPEEFQSLNALELVHPEDIVEARARLVSPQAMVSGTRTHELRFRAADGGWRWIEATSLTAASELFGDGIVAVLRDVSERREAEELRIRVKAEEASNEMKTMLLSMVSHELRTPLTAVKGFSSTLDLYWDHLTQDEIRDFARIIDRSVDHLSNLVSDLFTFTRLASNTLKLTLEPVELGEFLEQQVEQFRIAEAQRRFDYARPKQRFWVAADRLRLKQICDNLLANAVKYGAHHQPIVVGLRREGQWAQVSFRDFGPGVAPGDLERIFEPFYRAPGASEVAEGSGLGLSISRGLAERLGGTLHASLPADGGFEVTCRLPLTDRGAAAAQP